jgi:pyruvate/2-oxoglutarate dehydrogenase complex dihydrolipoamide dehydrogenase (E3) component
VQQHIKSLNWGYKADLLKMKVKYYNSYASFLDQHTIQLDNGKGKIEKVRAERIVIAVGGRPSYPGIPGDREFGITSDDLFSLPNAPGKTLVVGASYVALECAGFLTAFGYDTTVMVRSVYLRGFDQQMANRIADHMKQTHTKFIEAAVPTKLEKLENGKTRVHYEHCGEEKTDEFDTVLFAIGRYALTIGLNLQNAEVVAEANGKIKVNVFEQTNIPHIFAIGDVQLGRLELTPTAIMAGQLLAQRLYGK